MHADSGVISRKMAGKAGSPTTFVANVASLSVRTPGRRMRQREGHEGRRVLVRTARDTVSSVKSPLFDPSSPLTPLRAELRAAIDRVLDGNRFTRPEVAAIEHEFAEHLGVDTRSAWQTGPRRSRFRAARLLGGPGDEVIVPSFSF